MGIDISFIARPPRKLFDFFRSLPDPGKAIVESLQTVAHEKNVETFVPQEPEVNLSNIPFHMLCENIHVVVQAGTYLIDVRTNGGGPGYHAFVCDVVDHLSKAQGWTFALDEQVDETGYFQSRDFPALQDAHANWLKHLAQSMSSGEAQGDGVARIMLALETPVPAGVEGVTFTPIGPVDAGFLKSLSANEGPELAQAAAKWFPWWSKTPSAQDYANICRQLMWTEVPWHLPANHRELAAAKAAIAAAKLARQLERSIELPDVELEELRQLMSAKQPFAPPRQSGIGYRRKNCVWQLPGNWSVVLPGYWFADEDEGSAIFYFNDMFVRISVFDIKKKSDAKQGAVEPPPLGEDVIEIDSWEDSLRRFRFGRPLERQDDKNVSRMLVGANKDSMLLLTCGGDDDSFADLALKIAKSVN